MSQREMSYDDRQEAALRGREKRIEREAARLAQGRWSRIVGDVCGACGAAVAVILSAGAVIVALTLAVRAVIWATGLL